MRTTLSLDDDVASLLRKEMRRSGRSLKGAVNHFLRLGLMSADERREKPSQSMSPGLASAMALEALPQRCIRLAVLVNLDPEGVSSL